MFNNVWSQSVQLTFYFANVITLRKITPESLYSGCFKDYFLTRTGVFLPQQIATCILSGVLTPSITTCLIQTTHLLNRM